MKNSIFICFIFLTFLSSCKKGSDSKKASKAENYSEYISAFSPQYLKSTDQVKLVFTKKMVDSSQIGSEIKSDVFNISPSLSGKAIWLNEYTIAFTANKEDIKRNIPYVASASLKKLIGSIPDSLAQFNLMFQYIPLALTLNWDFRRADDQYEGYMKLEGQLKSSDEVSDIKKLVTAGMDKGPALEVEVSKSESVELEYYVVVHKIPRTESVRNLELKWLTNPDNSTSILTQSMSVPEKNKFIVTGIKEDRNDSRCLMVYFSDVLDKAQDIKGLVQVNKDSVKCSLTLDKDIIHVCFNTDEYRTGVLTVDQQIRNKNGLKLDSKFSHTFDFKEEGPQVQMSKSGNILPFTDKIIVPFEAINLNKVDIEVFKVFSNNVLYNLHLRYYDDDNNLTKLGRVVHQQTIDLKSLNEEPNKNNWITYGLDISQMIKVEPGALYEIRILFRPQYSDYHCEGVKLLAKPSSSNSENDQDDFTSYWSSYGSMERENDGESVDCYEYTNPCCISYYGREHFANKSILASNIALTYKFSKDQNESVVIAYNVLTAKPISGAIINVYDKQLQAMSNVKTDGSGFAKCSVNRTPAFVTAQFQDNYAYLKVDEEKSMTNSEFEIGGVSSKQGLKASIYTERGVWRPGD
ncbi:MAG: hypothetical protein ABIO44_10385, partial [Saprospiraceae bacterium]